MHNGAAGVSDRGRLSAHVLPFFGRERDRERILKALREGTRLLTIVGPSGIGKSRLARSVAEGFDAGRVFVCDLAAARTAVDFRAAVAKAVGLRVGDGGGALVRGLQRQGDLLLVLDNAEYVVQEAAEVIDGWIADCPRLQILSTSLEPFFLPGETRYTLGPLQAEDAVALYLDRARRVGGSQAIFGADVAALVERLDRIPLAIELAAARAHVLPPAQFLGRIGQRFQLLQGRQPGRHGSLEQAITCSWDLLREYEQIALAQAAIFVGGFTLEAAEEVLECGPDAPPVLEILSSLVSKGLLAHDGADPPRFTPYESLREYAFERLEEMGKVEATIRRHASYFLDLGEALAEMYEGPVQAQERLDLERDNLLAAHRRLYATDPETAARIGLALWRSYNRQGTIEAEILLLDETIAAARRASSPRLLNRALVARARSKIRLGRFPECREDVDEALRMAREANDEEGVALALLEYGAAASFNREHDAAREAFLAVRATARKLSDTLLESAASNGLGVVEFYGGNPEGSVPHFLHAIELARRAGSEVREASYASNLGHAYTVIGDYEGARTQLEAVLAIARRRGDEGVWGIVLINLANVAITEGALDEAQGYLREGLPRVQRIGAAILEAAGVASLGQIALERGEFAAARARLAEATQLLLDCGDSHMLPQVSTLIALTHVLAGSAVLAREALAQCEAQAPKDPSLSAARELVRSMLRVVEARLGGEPARAAEDATRALVEEIAARPLRHSEVLVQTLRIARRFLEEPVEKAPEEMRRLIVGTDVSYFEWEGWGRVSLRTRKPLRLLLGALVSRRISHPGQGLGVEELARAAWPGETILPKAAANRVYDAVRSLRKLGLGRALVRRDGGYLLSPSLDVVWAEE